MLSFLENDQCHGTRAGIVVLPGGTQDIYVLQQIREKLKRLNLIFAKLVPDAHCVSDDIANDVEKAFKGIQVDTTGGK